MREISPESGSPPQCSPFSPKPCHVDDLVKQNLRLDESEEHLLPAEGGVYHRSHLHVGRGPRRFTYQSATTLEDQNLVIGSWRVAI